MSEWKEYKLGDIADVKGGKRLPKGELLVNYETPHPYIRITDLGEKWIRKAGLQFVPSEIQKNISRYIVNSGDVILSIVGSIGFVGRIPQELNGANLTENCVKFLTNKKIIDNDFLYYFLLSSIGQEEINKRNVGSTQPKLPLYNIKDVDISLPPLPEQTAIASILSSLDDKIDLLHRQNATLEKMAETLFRQWFIEEAKEDWDVKPLGSLVTVKRGSSPRPIQDYLSDTGLRWLKISDATKENSPYIFEIKEYIKIEGLNKTTHLKAGTLVLSNSATPGIPKILLVDSCIHDGWLHFPKSHFSNEFLYLLFKKIRPELLQQGNGSIFTNLKTDILKEYRIPIPDKESLLFFDNKVKQVFEKILNNTTQIRTLTALRDVLLPKLMSGEVRVD
jgi:type I restriction enzyme S subunit